MIFDYTRPSGFPPIVKNLIIINVLVWVAQLIFHKDFNLTEFLALYPVDTPDFKPYQIATHMFAHASYDAGGGIAFYHILFNMFTLWMFGRVLENVWGPKRFLLFYLLCGLGAAACHLLVQHLRYDPEVVAQLGAGIATNDQALINIILPKAGFLASAIGASGAIMGVMAGFCNAISEYGVVYHVYPSTGKAKWAMLGLAALDLFGGFASISGITLRTLPILVGRSLDFFLSFTGTKPTRKRSIN